MKSIEERAQEYAPDAFYTDLILPASEGYIVKVQRAAYITGATEQRKIDIEKAAEWWESRCDYLGISKYQIELFKKAMGEGV